MSPRITTTGSTLSSSAPPPPPPRLTPDEIAAAQAARNYRRNSLAASLHANLINLGAHPDAFDVARRRLSNVSDVVSRKISNTIGWRSLSVSVELTVSQVYSSCIMRAYCILHHHHHHHQGTSLCAQYIRSRLRRAGIFHRKLGLKRMRSAKLLAASSALIAANDVCPELAAVGAELEKLRPELFERVARQIGRGPFNSEQRVGDALKSVAREMLRAGECNWSKVVALYAVAGGIAVDCVRQGKPEFIPVIQRAMAAVLAEDLASWVQANGGWAALGTRYRPVQKQIEWQTNAVVIFIALATLLVAVLSFAIRIYVL